MGLNRFKFFMLRNGVGVTNVRIFGGKKIFGSFIDVGLAATAVSTKL